MWQLAGGPWLAFLFLDGTPEGDDTIGPAEVRKGFPRGWPHPLDSTRGRPFDPSTSSGQAGHPAARKLAGRLGVEPRFSDPESDVLPVRRPPIRLAALAQGKPLRCAQDKQGKPSGEPPTSPCGLRRGRPSVSRTLGVSGRGVKREPSRGYSPAARRWVCDGRPWCPH